MDFQQGLIATIHDYGLGKLDLPDFRRQLRQRPTSLLIPCLMEEFSRPALGLIREVLAELSGLEELVIALSAETSDDVAAAEAFFSDMPFPVRVHWTNGPAVAESLQSLQSLGLNVTGPPGKGWAVWQGLGVACRNAEIVGLFDADIRTFSGVSPKNAATAAGSLSRCGLRESVLQPSFARDPISPRKGNTPVCGSTPHQPGADFWPDALLALSPILSLPLSRRVRVH